MQDKDKDTTPSPTKHTSNPRSLHSKRSFASKHQANNNAHTTLSGANMHSLDSPAYDASEEDNDPLTDSGASVVSVSNLPSRLTKGNKRISNRPHALASSLVSSDEAVDSPTYDGDVESSATLGPDPVPSHTRLRYTSQHHNQPTSPGGSVASTLSPTSPNPPPHSTLPSHNHVTNAKPQPARTNHSPPSLLRPTPSHPSRPTEPSPATALPSSSTPLTFDPAKLTPEDIQSWFQEVLEGPGCKVNDQWYKINPPPKHRPVRIYADGVYDLFHFGHALQLRQAKLAFPSVPPETLPDHPSLPPSSSADVATLNVNISASRITDDREWTPGVYLLAGVNSDEQCEEHKNRTVMTHAERCEAVRHCRWIDEVVPDAPWVIDGEFLDKYDIDYVAHDADPYFSAGHEDVYAFCKVQGKFLPTRRTPGISTSDLLARLVSGYRHRVFDKKLAKMGMHALIAEGSDWDESRVGSAAASQVVSRAESPVNGGEKEKA